MTLIEQIQKLLLKLSPAQQREALDFVAFLQLRSTKTPELAKDEQRGERIKDAFAQLAKMKTFSDITDPVAWQRNTREDRGLPGRAA